MKGHCSINPVSDNKSESENETEEISEDESEDESETESEDKTVNTIAVHTDKSFYTSDSFQTDNIHKTEFTTKYSICETYFHGKAALIYHTNAAHKLKTNQVINKEKSKSTKNECEQTEKAKISKTNKVALATEKHSNPTGEITDTDANY